MYYSLKNNPMTTSSVLEQFGYTSYMEVCEIFTKQISRFKLKTWQPFIKPKMNFLNLGCGGKILWPRVFKACHANLIYIDREPDRYDSIQAFLEKDNNAIEFVFQEQDFDWNHTLSFKDKEIDLCVADFLFSELRSDDQRDALLSEMKRVSKRSIIMNLDYGNFSNFQSTNFHEVRICNFLSEISEETLYPQTLEYFESRKEEFSLEINYSDIPGNEVDIVHAQLIPHFLSGNIYEQAVQDFLLHKDVVKKLPSERLQIVQF